MTTTDWLMFCSLSVVAFCVAVVWIVGVHILFECLQIWVDRKLEKRRSKK